MRAALMILASVLVLLGPPAAAQDVAGRTEAALDWINSYRAKAGRAPLRLSRRLEAVAAHHARDMARSGFFGHVGSDGGDVADRARRAGYAHCYIAENIARGQRDMASVLSGWARSRGHRRNLLSPQVRGVALVEAPGHIWVMVLGRRGC